EGEERLLGRVRVERSAFAGCAEEDRERVVLPFRERRAEVALGRPVDADVDEVRALVPGDPAVRRQQPVRSDVAEADDLALDAGVPAGPLLGRHVANLLDGQLARHTRYAANVTSS